MIIELADSQLRVEARAFRLRSTNLSSIGMLSGEMNSHLLTSRWVANLTWPIQQQEDWRTFDAIIATLGGISGMVRAHDPARREPYYNKEVQRSVSNFDDNTTFDDGSGWLNGPLPPSCIVRDRAHRGAKHLVMSGLPESKLAVVRPGDVFELRPNGVAVDHGHLYLVNGVSNTNEDGHCGVSFVPGLRAGVNAGDMVVLKEPKTVFRLENDDQGEIQVTPPNHGRFGLSLVEVLPRII